MIPPGALDRVAEFEAVLLSWLEEVRPGCPTFMLPDAPAVKVGACISCGIIIPAGWRCDPCREAITTVLAEFGK